MRARHWRQGMWLLQSDVRTWALRKGCTLHESESEIRLECAPNIHLVTTFSDDVTTFHKEIHEDIVVICPPQEFRGENHKVSATIALLKEIVSL